MLDFEKISEEHKSLFPRADLESQKIKLEEELVEASRAFDHYLNEVADYLIVCAGIYRFNPDLARRKIDEVYRNMDKLGLIPGVEDHVVRKWEINKKRKWVWNGETYKHEGKDGQE